MGPALLHHVLAVLVGKHVQGPDKIDEKVIFFSFDFFLKKFSVCVCSPPGYGKLEAHEQAGGQGEDEGAVVALVAPRHELNKMVSQKEVF